MSAVGLTENVKGDVRKFEIWYSGREVVYIVQVFVFCTLSTFSSLTYLSCIAYGCVHVSFAGSYSRGQSCLADRDSEDSHQPAETATRSVAALRVCCLCLLSSLTGLVSVCLTWIQPCSGDQIAVSLI